MTRVSIATSLAVAALLALLAGCAAQKAKRHSAPTSAPVAASATRIEEPAIQLCSGVDARDTPPPLDPEVEPEFWELDLQTVIQICLESSDVLRDIGGLVLDSPQNVNTVFDPAIQETDPLVGVDAALSEFDAALLGSMSFENNDRALNNIFEGRGARLFRQDLGFYNLELSKRTAFGTNLAIRNVIDYDSNNAPPPGNNVPALPWVDRLEFEVRQPLLRGAGVVANRIAGVSDVPGVYNGVLIARIRTDLSLAEFEASVRELVSNVENAYWELYFAYRELDATIAARERALRTWNEVRALSQTGQRGGEKARLAQAEEQFFRLDAAVEDAVWGREIDDTRTNLFQGHGGVHTSERRLRMAMGIPVSDGRLIRPADQPPLAEVMFDWDNVVDESLERRVELRRQRWQVKQREMELLASRSFTLPRLDAVGGYRFRGLGNDLINADGDGKPRFDNAVGNLTDGDFQEWQLGVDLSIPIGNRRARAAVRNAELRLSRERAILAEQERQVVADLSDSISEKRRAYVLARKSFNRTKASRDQLAALEEDFTNADRIERTRLLDLLLNAQLLAAEAETRFHRSMAEYMVAVKNVHYEKGSLLSLNEIHLSEGPWPCPAYVDAGERIRSRRRSPKLNDFVHRPTPRVSWGEYQQSVNTDPWPTQAVDGEASAPSGAPRLAPLPE